jgi:Family of unknown function (DUF5677)
MDDSGGKLKKYLELSKLTLNEALADLPKLKFDDDSQQLGVAVIYATILQSSGECLVLLETFRSVTAVAGMIRSIVESYADLCALIINPEYVERMIAITYKEKLRLLKHMTRAPEDPFHKDLAGKIDVPKGQKELTEQLAEYAARGHHPPSNYDRFKSADLIYVFESLYWSLSLQSHNDISSLERRHIRIKNGKPELVLFRNNDPEELTYYFDAILAVVTDSSARTHELLKSERAPHYQTRKDELNALRKLPTSSPYRGDS